MDLYTVWLADKDPVGDHVTNPVDDLDRVHVVDAIGHAVAACHSIDHIDALSVTNAFVVRVINAIIFFYADTVRVADANTVRVADADTVRVADADSDADTVRVADTHTVAINVPDIVANSNGLFNTITHDV